MSVLHRSLVAFLPGAILGWIVTTPCSAAPAEIFLAVPNVTVEMEKAFLAKYKTTVEKQDPAGWIALNADDPAMDPQLRKDLTAFIGLGLLMEKSNPIRSYSFEAVHPGQHDPPTQLDGKTCVDNLPAAIAFKVSFAPSPQAAAGEPDALSVVHLLGLQDHELKIVGVREDSHAVIPEPVAPMPTKDNYGLTPNVRPAPEPDQIKFTSLDNFISTLKQPNLELLQSGESEFEYYGIYRLKPNLLVYAGGPRKKDANFTWSLSVKNAQGESIPGKPRWIALLDNKLDGGSFYHEVTGTVFEIPPGNNGTLTFQDEYLREDESTASSFSRTVDWK